MRKKLIFTLSLLLVMVVALAGCGDKKSAESEEENTDVEVSVEEGTEEVKGVLPEDVLDMNGPLVVISTKGMGQVARTVEGAELEFDDEYPASQTVDHVVKGTTLVIGAKADEGSKFIKWTVNGKDYSTEQQTTITADQELQIVAWFGDEGSGEDSEEMDGSQVYGGAYGYIGTDPLEVAVYKYMAEEVSKDYEKADVSIPTVNIIYIDGSAENDTLVYGDFWVENYNVEGDTLKCVSGGHYPGVMHVDQDYVVTAFDKVEDGADFDSSAKKLFGDHYEDFMKVYSDSDSRNELRKKTIADYVKLNGLSVSKYQDEGWDPVELK